MGEPIAPTVSQNNSNKLIFKDTFTSFSQQKVYRFLIKVSYPLFAL